MNITLNTKIDYDFSNFEVSPEKQLAIIRKYEKQVEDIYFDYTEVKYVTDSEGNEWFKLFIYMYGETIEIHFDKTMYLTQDGYKAVQEILGSESKPFYDTVTYEFIHWLIDDGQYVKLNLQQAITLTKVVSNMIMKERKGF
jgi:hypothetical protein